jgi:hypothetical protein
MASRARAVPVRLTIKRRRKLEQIVRAGSSPQRLVLRAMTVVPDERGRPGHQVDDPPRPVDRGWSDLRKFYILRAAGAHAGPALPGQAAAERIASEFPLPAAAVSTTGVIPLHPLDF